MDQYCAIVQTNRSGREFASLLIGELGLKKLLQLSSQHNVISIRVSFFLPDFICRIIIMHHNACLVNSNCIAIFMSSRREGTVEDALQDLDEDLTGSVK